MQYYLSLILIAVSSVLACFIALPMFKIIQLSGYKARGVVAWWKGTGGDMLLRYASLMFFGFIAMIVFIGCFGEFEYVPQCAPALFILLEAVFIISCARYKSNDVKYTGRLVRMLVVNSVLTVGLGALVAWASYYSVFCQTLVCALALLSPFVALLSNAITTPFEKLNNRKYVKRAKAKLSELAPVVIGITGSYGKTTAKNILKAMLETTYDVLATPSSYNTPMGVCLTVNNELSGQKYFIAEMGARYKGDIRELCDITSPKYGIITAVGDMHMETLGSRENVANTKYELAESLPEGGLLALNGYNEGAFALTERTSKCEVSVTGDKGNIRYENLKIGGNGTSFDLIINDKRYPVTTELLGKHIAENVCVCAVIATACGVSPEDIVRAANALAPVEHRLQLIPSADPLVTVIDDGYNSNPQGAENALGLLSSMSGKKIIITPGFVELGPIEKECNIALGEKIAAVCDYAFVVGSRGADIKKGAIKGGMADGCITCVDSRDAAVAALGGISGERVILFENDLPDNIK